MRYARIFLHSRWAVPTAVFLLLLLSLLAEAI